MAAVRTFAVMSLVVFAVVCGVARMSASQNGNVITLNVAAFDSHGQPVADLKSEEFQVTDQGKPQRIVSFRRNGDAPQLVQASNTKSTSPVILILFDLLNANMGNSNLAQDEIIQVLGHLESSDSVYLYLLTSAGTLYPIHEIPEANTEMPSSASPWTQQIRPLMKSAIDKVFGMRAMDEQLVSLRVQTTYRALELLASKMKPIPGWKNLVWISHGIPLNVRNPNGEWTDYTSTVQRFATDLDRNEIALSTVERGDNPGSRDDAVMQMFAEMTGGKIYDANLEKVVSEIFAASRSGYVIQYAAPPEDGKYHKIRVTSSRKGLRIQTKQGYNANR